MPGEYLPILTEEPQRAGYTFAGWNSKADGTGQTFRAGEDIVLFDSSLRLYALWEKK